MSINISDLNNYFDSNSSSSLFDNKSRAYNLRELSKKELQTSGGGDNSGFRTIVVSDEDLDVYIIDNSFPVNVVHSPNSVKIEPGERINFNNGNVTMRQNGSLDITFSDSDSAASNSFD